jgi:hypothetical protein
MCNFLLITLYCHAWVIFCLFFLFREPGPATPSEISSRKEWPGGYSNGMGQGRKGMEVKHWARPVGLLKYGANILGCVYVCFSNVQTVKCTCVLILHD